jgi:hypothetical protein
MRRDEARLPLWSLAVRDVFGDCSVLGDTRWLGSYGVVVDVVAMEHSTILSISANDIRVHPSANHLDREISNPFKATCCVTCYAGTLQSSPSCIIACASKPPKAPLSPFTYLG